MWNTSASAENVREQITKKYENFDKIIGEDKIRKRGPEKPPFSLLSDDAY